MSLRLPLRLNKRLQPHHEKLRPVEIVKSKTSPLFSAPRAVVTLLRIDAPSIDFYEWVAKITGRVALIAVFSSLLIEDRRIIEEALLFILFFTGTFLIFRFLYRRTVLRSSQRRGIYSYPRPSRAFIRIYNVWVFISALAWAGQIRSFVLAEGSPDNLLILFAFTAGAFLSAYYSFKLVKAQVSDLNYVKGTSTCREALIYASALMLLVLFSFAGMNEVFGWFGSAILAAAGIIGFARLSGTGYKEFREALDTAKAI